jgi:hypothetical protein
MTENIDIKFKTKTYQDRRRSLFIWTLVLYIFIAILICSSIDLRSAIRVIIFLTVLFILDYSRRLSWIKYALDKIITDSKGVSLVYYEKDKLVTADILWNDLKVNKSSTFTKNSTRNISIINDSTTIASFYADTDNGIDNNKILELYNNLQTLKTAYA